MRAVHRFIVVSIVLLCGLLGPASQDLVPRATARAAAAVIPADLIPPGVPSINDCPMVAPTLRPIWQYLREFLLARIRAVAEWFLSPRPARGISLEKRGAGSVVTEYVIGAAGLAERLGLGIRLVLGRERGGFVARWDQLDLRDPEHPMLTCPLEHLSAL